MYIHERAQWPHFHWDAAAMATPLAEVRHLQGRLLGRMEALGFQARDEATLQILTQDVLKTSEIEGERLDAALVRSSIARKLGLEAAALPKVDRNVEGIVQVMLDATRRYDQPLSAERLFGWHAALFPAGHSGLRRIAVGQWRTQESGPMRVVSGPYGREKIHFEAPDHSRLRSEMKQFIRWFNEKSENDWVIQSAVAHFWFVTIHPFDDGNGRIARALADMLLARSEKSSHRFYSISAEICRVRDDYYDVLECSQKGPLDISPWIDWYLQALHRAIIASETLLEVVLAKARFWKAHAGESLNDRQRKIINRLLDGFEGKLTSSKWAKLAKCSQDTASRDIQNLLDRRILAREAAGGRSTSYRLVTP